MDEDMWSNASGSNRHVIPNLPDLILYRIFEALSYKEVVRLEVVCRRWRTIIFRLLKKHVQELNVEQSVTYSVIHAVQQKPLKRLSVSCNFEAIDFLSGVLRRSRASVTKLSCDIRFLAKIDQLNVDREANRRYWSNVEELWIVLVKLDDATTEKFLNIYKLLFLNLCRITIQIHECAKQGANICRIKNAIVDQFPKLMINMEIHAKSSSEIFNQLIFLSSITLESLKLICLDYDPETLSLTEYAKIAKEQKIVANRFVLRDWTLRCEPNECMLHMPMDTLRLSSCAIENVNNFISAVYATFCLFYQESEGESQRKMLPKNGSLRILNTRENIPLDSKERFTAKDLDSNLVKKPSLRCIELAGQCVFHGLGHLDKKAHKEFEFRLKSILPLLVIDSSHICYND
uniref:F-box domain-containing protein n=1 Tax=Syphacia muris TaxID=451379 RepID=A0A158R5W0_9BILA